MTEQDVHGSCPPSWWSHSGRLSQDEVFVFDSTGTALQDVAAAILVYERAAARAR